MSDFHPGYILNAVVYAVSRDRHLQFRVHLNRQDDAL